MPDQIKWEEVCMGDTFTQRAWVGNGYIYMAVFKNQVSMCFVPEVIERQV